MIYQYIITVFDSVSHDDIGNEIVLVRAKSQIASLMSVKKDMADIGVDFYNIELIKASKDDMFLEELGFKMKPIEKKDIPDKPKNYDQLCQLLRDNGYIAYKKKK